MEPSTDLLIQALYALSTHDRPSALLSDVAETLQSEGGDTEPGAALHRSAAMLAEMLRELERGQLESGQLDRSSGAASSADRGVPAPGPVDGSRPLTALLDELPCIVYRCRADLDWTMQYLNRQTGRIIGYEPEELIENRTYCFGALIHPEDRPKVAEVVGNALANGAPFHASYRFRHHSGSYMWLWEQGKAVEPEIIEGFIVDITASKEAEQQSAENLARSRRQQEAISVLARQTAILEGKQGDAFEAIAAAALTALDLHRVSIWLRDRDGFELAFVSDEDQAPDRPIERARINEQESPQYFRALERERIIAVGDVRHDERTRTLPFGAGVPDSVGAVLDAAIWHGETMRGVLCLNRREPGAWRPDEVRFAGELAEQVMRALANTERQEVARLMAYQARHDALTGLVNRFEFEQQVKQAIQQAGRHGAGHALLYLDLDRFKGINDNWGHSAGDEILRRVSQLLKGALRKSDTLARVGGDEFAALLEHTDLEEARAVAEKLIEVLTAATFAWQEKEFALGASVGLTEITSGSGDFASVLRAADIACYTSKQAGRNQINTYSEIDDELRQTVTDTSWLSRINRLFEANRFELVFQRIQPIVPDRQGARMEVLVRVRDDDGRLIQPTVFLPAAERYGLMEQVDRWTLKTVAHELQRCGASATVLVSVNLSSASVGSPSFVQFAREILAEYGIPASRFCFEIPEHGVGTQLDHVKALVERLHELGAQVALDGFGRTGASFGYLKALAVDWVKLDRALVRGVPNDPVDRGLVEATQRIAGALGIETVAMAVEYPSLVEHLRGFGIDYVQGFAIHRPESWPPIWDKAFTKPQTRSDT